MKLLLDEMWSPVVAQQLRLRGFDVVAVAERPELRTKLDEIIFATAQDEGRVVVTENIGDFRRIALEALQRGIVHRGLILTTNDRYPRRDSRTLGRVTTALLEVLTGLDDLSGIEWWLK